MRKRNNTTNLREYSTALVTRTVIGILRSYRIEEREEKGGVRVNKGGGGKRDSTTPDLSSEKCQ
jgi:hypothetical protein